MKITLLTNVTINYQYLMNTQERNEVNLFVLAYTHTQAQTHMHI